MTRKIIYSLLSLFIIHCQLQAINYFVSNAGNDTHTGLTRSFPFLTLQKAVSVVAAGDSVFVENGKYAGFDIRNKHGNQHNRIVFQALGNQVLINKRGPNREDGINVENANYITIDGFIVSDMPGAGNGIRLVFADFCVVRNCTCDRNAERGIFTGFTDDILIEHNVCMNSVDEHGIYVSNSSDRPIIRYNECFRNNNIGIHLNGDISQGGDGIISDAQIYGNKIYDNGRAAGINMDGVENPIIYNNLIYDNHFAQGIALFQQDGAIVTRGAKIFNNTIIVPSDGRWGILMYEGAQVNTEIYNNIIINNHTWRGCISAENLTGLKSDFNLLNDKMSFTGDGSSVPLQDWQQKGLDLHSIIGTDLTAIFRNPANFDFHLASNSVAINAGTNLVSSVVHEDFDHRIRPIGSAYDLGCFEFPEATSTESPTNSKALSVFPNPVSNWIHIEGAEEYSGIQILDPLGIINLEIRGTELPNKVNLATLIPGIYFLRVTNGVNGDCSTIKVIKN
ncbi:MAG: right-handed parallel beta-helix repeat-containing protein [Bacteroidota bacterium]|nr:right-handed parallel beta-helix repeat-containing protein [Bacteroidota bacterium]